VVIDTVTGPAWRLLGSRTGFAALMAVYMPAALWADGHLARVAQLVVSILTWLLLACAFAAATRIERRQLVVVVIVATGFEILFSIIWGLYRYRYGNLPMYVPPGHGLIYLLAIRLGGMRLVTANRRRSATIVTVLVGAWALGGVVLASHPDIVGVSLVPFLLVCLWRSERWNVYVGAFVATTLLELFGTQFGNWRWAAAVPALGVPQGNPPSAIAAGYCLLDTIVLWIAMRRLDTATRDATETAVA
jgi:hypothetical protein